MNNKLTSVSGSAKPHVGISVYVHFPWCRKKCPYCDFLSIAADPNDLPHERYASAVLAELGARVPTVPSLPLKSVFFGGGTPSLWAPEQLGRTLEGIVRAFGGGTNDVEVTAECNPTSFDEQRARALREAGVNRISLGVQGLNAERLKFLGRWHTADEGLSAVEAAVASGMPRVSADLIYGVNQQPAKDAASEATRIAELGVTHLSSYALTIEPQTAFGALARKGRLPLAREETVADSFLAVSDALGAQGFAHYEVSNFARQGHVSEHNLGYWRGQDYLGLGCGAYGTVSCGSGSSSYGLPSPDPAGSEGRFRYRNLAHPEKYMAEALRHVDSERPLSELQSSLEPISESTALIEAILLGLRIAEGIDTEALAVQTGAPFWTDERHSTVRRLLERGQLRQTGTRLSIPKDQWLLSDAIIRDLM